MKITAFKLASLFTLLAAMSACGGGGGGSPAQTPTTLTVAGTAATGLAISGVSVTGKCKVGTGSTTTLADGTFILSVTDGQLPCILEINNPIDGTMLHTVAVGSGSAITANITPLTEMIVARIVGIDPSVYFTSFNASSAENKLSLASVKLAQADVSIILAGTVDASFLADYISTPLKAATANNLALGDLQDQLLDKLKVKLTGGSLVKIVTALANTANTADIKIVVNDLHAHFAYVANAGSNTISQYTITADGNLSPMITPTVATGVNPTAVVVHPNGQFVYVVNGGSYPENINGNISQYNVSPDGSLKPMVTSVISAGSNPSSISIHPSGQYLYVINSDITIGGSISQFTIAADGSLVPMSAPIVALGNHPSSVTIHPNGKFAFVKNFDTVSQYSVSSLDGSLALMTTPPIASDIFTVSGAIHPNGLFSYTVNFLYKIVSQFTISPVDSAVTPMSVPTVVSGNNPVSISIHPNGRFAYVMNFSTTSASSSISQYTLGSDGGLTPMLVPQVSTGVTMPGLSAVAPSGNTATPVTSCVPVTTLLDPIINVNQGNNGSPVAIIATQYCISSIPIPPVVTIDTVNVTFDPSGRFAYVPNDGSPGVSQYAVAIDGGLSPMGIATTGTRPKSIAIR